MGTTPIRLDFYTGALVAFTFDVVEARRPYLEGKSYNPLKLH